MAGFSGQKLRDDGQQLVLLNADAEWKARASEAIDEFARSGARFTSEDVIAVAGLPPDSPNALGSMLAAKVKMKVIRWTGQVTTGLRVARRSGIQRVWIGARFA